VGKRTQIQYYDKVERAEDLEVIIKDKRKAKRANKKKVKRRNRHYQKTILKHLSSDFEEGSLDQRDEWNKNDNQ
jgi:hypothetical protein